MSTALLHISAALVVVTCLVHTIVGERRLIGPLCAQRDGVLQHDLARQVLRFAWHLMSGFGLVVALGLYLAATTSIPGSLVWLTGIVLLGGGLFDAIYTRGKHIGWPLLTAAGASAIASQL